MISLGIHEKALEVQSRRTQLISNNLANADTPGYQAQDIDFRAVLANAAGSDSNNIQLTANIPLWMPNHGEKNHKHYSINSSHGLTSSSQFRTPSSPSLDNNTVDVSMERAAFAENNLRFNATLTFINGKIQSMMKALRGE
ncbi:MAG: flagellar basal body rod protein FlgB [Pseudomonadota bacterium]